MWWGGVGRKGESVFMAKLNVMRTFRHETLLSQPMETKKVHLSKCFMRTINPLELTSSTSSAFPQAPAAEAGLRMATKPFSCGTRFVPDELGFRERFLVLVQCSQRSGYLFVPGFGVISAEYSIPFGFSPSSLYLHSEDKLESWNLWPATRKASASESILGHYHCRPALLVCEGGQSRALQSILKMTNKQHKRASRTSLAEGINSRRMSSSSTSQTSPPKSIFISVFHRGRTC